MPNCSACSAGLSVAEMAVALMVGLTRRVWLGLAGVGLGLALWGVLWLRFPSDTKPEGAYYRVASAVNRDDPAAFFAYLETAAQHACFTIGSYRAKAKQKVMASFPEAEREKTLAILEPFASNPDGPRVFALTAKAQGWLQRLRQDLSGVDHVEQDQERATVQTVRGTRYPFRRRENGIWGLTLFTAQLVEEAERAARDYQMLEGAAADYDRKNAAQR